MKTSQQIVEYIKKRGEASGKDLVLYLGSISDRAIRKQLKIMIDKGILEKKGRPPKVYYMMASKKPQKIVMNVDKKIISEIDKRYLYISVLGEAIYGFDGFLLWCEKTKQDPTKTAVEYYKTIVKYDKFKKNNLIDGYLKIKNTFDEVFLDELFYIDFYSIERFGKTKLGLMLLYAKQTQDKKLINIIINEIRNRVLSVISKYKIDGVLFVPPTVKRETQFMREMERCLKLMPKTMSVTKIKTEIVIPQKTLNKLEDRIENAKRTIVVGDVNKYKNVLIIDDAVGSGATINEIASQIRKKNICRGKIVGLAITGSFNGFEVISEI